MKFLIKKVNFSSLNTSLGIILIVNHSRILILFFPGPLAFCKKAVERVNSEKNILNSSVECVEWSGVEWFFLEKVICMYIIRSASMS